MAKSGINKAIILGRIGQDPETRYTQNGDAVTTLSVATSEKWKDKNTGETKEVTEWHRVVLWRKLGEIAGEYCRKGGQVYIEGKLTTRKWQDQNGNDKYTTEIVADEMQLIGGKQESAQPEQDAKHAAYNVQKPSKPEPDYSEDIPF